MRDLSDRARDAYAAALAGDFRAFEAIEGELERAGTDVARAWALALRGARWHAEPGRGALPDIDRVAALATAGEGAREAAALACAQAERACVLAFDVAGLERWAALHARVVDALPRKEGTLWLDVARCWRAALAGSTGDLADIAPRVHAEASSARIAPLVLETTALRAIAAMVDGEIDEATAIARRASRMSRTEALPQWEYLANLILARVRRVTGKAHLATRILAALGRAAPPPWHAAIAWELLLAGDLRGADEIAVPADDPASRASRELRGLLGAAMDGDRSRLETRARAIRAALERAPMIAREIDDLVVALDPAASPSAASDALRAWATGDSALPPLALAGLAAHSTASEVTAGEAVAAYVVAHPAGAARRVLGLGAALAGVAPLGAGQARRPHVRTETAIAALALAPSRTATKAELFAAVYGFAYNPRIHRTMLNVLLHRARGYLGDSATVARPTEDDVALEVHRTFAVPDPRCTASVDTQLLRLLARAGAGTTQDAADALGIPLRTAQVILQQLVEDGVCVAERQGRKVSYRVEDTTFSEPTKH